MMKMKMLCKIAQNVSTLSRAVRAVRLPADRGSLSKGYQGSCCPSRGSRGTIKRFGSVIIPHYNPGFGFLPIPIVFLAIPHGGLHSKTPAEVGGQSILECLSYQQAFLSCLFLLYHWHQNQSLLIQEYGEREKTSFYYCLGNHNN